VRPVLERVRTALAEDLRTPEALDAMDAWAMANAGSVDGDADAPRLFADIADALLGVHL
jgi:L-cysteine:1D-myo-inositol 2-amino-2-deoxy-alpha-D-glucopyranoside ligase